MHILLAKTVCIQHSKNLKLSTLVSFFLTVSIIHWHFFYITGFVCLVGIFSVEYYLVGVAHGWFVFLVSYLKYLDKKQIFVS
jgi:hypothetical protein